jgi:spermidine/putrescine transport system ATP-binding protein
MMTAEIAVKAHPAVTIRNVRKTFGHAEVLKGVSLDIAKGEFFSLLGPSGCGKTTLLRLIGGFEIPGSGEIELDGVSVVDQPPYARATNMIFQNLALFPHLSVFENVAFSLRLRKLEKAEISRRVDHALNMVKLADFGARKASQLSGGQRQRIAMARALVNEPPVLLLDEPLAALDLQLRVHMQQELRHIQRALGNTFIFVTHDQGEAMSMSDRVAVMRDGEIVQVGTPEAIYEQPATRFVAQFVGHANILDGKVTAIGPQGATVTCGALTFQAPGTHDVLIGQTVAIALRYQRISLAQDGKGVSGIVAERSFLGDAVRLVVALKDGTLLSADIMTGGAIPAPQINDQARLTWRDADVRLLTH